MTDEQFQEMKDGYVEFITKLMTDTGGLNPSITVLGRHLKDDKPAIIYVPIPSKYMKSDEAKDEFVDNVIPDLADKVSDMVEIKAVAWASEAWLRSIDLKDGMDPEEAKKNWKELAIKKEVLITTFEGEAYNKTCIMEIVRKGKQVNEDGDLVDVIELLDLPEFNDKMDGAESEGRFTGLYEKFTKGN